MEKLKEFNVKDKMIKRDDMLVEKLPADNIVLSETLKEMTAAGKGERLPILNDQGHPVYMIHRSAIERFLATKALADPPLKPEDLKKLSVKDLLDDANLKQLMETSFTTVKEDATLAEAKAAMDRTPKCQDVFVTKGGTKNEPVLGWITNAIIQELAKV
jgi:hypothetical protein